MEKSEFLRLLPKLIREDDEVKGAIITALSGVMATKDDIKRVIENSDKKFEALQKQLDQRFEAMDKRFESMQNTMDKRFEAMDKRFESMQNTMDKRFESMQNTMDKRFEAMDKRFETLIVEMRKGFELAQQERKELKASIDSFGRRTGTGLENAVLFLLKDKLIQESISSSEIKREKLSDKEGKIFWKNYTTDIDVLIQNGKVILIEIKNYADNRDGYHLLKNAELYKLQFNRDYDELMVICLEINQKNLEQLLQQNIRVIAGKIKNK